jgi:hypothetical protein
MHDCQDICSQQLQINKKTIGRCSLALWSPGLDFLSDRLIETGNRGDFLNSEELCARNMLSSEDATGRQIASGLVRESGKTSDRPDHIKSYVLTSHGVRLFT